MNDDLMEMIDYLHFEKDSDDTSNKSDEDLVL